MTTTSLWCMKEDNVRYTSRNKEESSKTLQRLQKRMQKVFRKSEVYVCSQEEPIPEICEEKASIMVDGSKSENFHHVPQDHRISVPEAPVDVEPMPSTSAADVGATIDIEPTPSASAADSDLCGRRRFSITPRENVEFFEWLNREILPLNMEIEGTSSQIAAVSGATADMEPIPSTSAASSRAPADTEITLYQCAADSVAIADTEPTFFIAESDETDYSETDSDTELDLISYLADYMEHARDMPCADPQSTPGLSTCHSIDCTDRDELNIFTLLRAEDTFDSFSLDEEPTPVPDIDEHLALTQDAEVFYDALVSADHPGHSRSTDRVPGFLLDPEMLLMLLLPFLWLVTQLISIMTGLRNHIRQVWHEENVEGPPTNKGSVAAAADP